MTPIDLAIKKLATAAAVLLLGCSDAPEQINLGPCQFCADNCAGWDAIKVCDARTQECKCKEKPWNRAGVAYDRMTPAQRSIDWEEHFAPEDWTGCHPVLCGVRCNEGFVAIWGMSYEPTDGEWKDESWELCHPEVKRWSYQEPNAHLSAILEFPDGRVVDARGSTQNDHP